MKKSTFAVGLIAITSLTACLANDTQRGLVGAGAGAVVATTTGGNPVAGAVIGGVGGVLCDDVGLC